MDLPASEPGRRRALVAAELVALVTLMWSRLRGLTGALDLHAEDEVYYEGLGRALCAGTFDDALMAWSPLYCALYGLTALLPLGTPTATGLYPADVVFGLLYVASTLALWYAVRPIGPVLGLLAAALWCTSAPVLQYDTIERHPAVYLLSGGLVFVAAGLLQRQHTIWGLAALACAAVNRSELTPWLLLVAAGLCTARAGLPMRRIGAGALTVGLSLIALQASLGAHRDRAWLAFRQHYAATRALAESAPHAGEAFRFPDARIVADFGDAESLSDAVLVAPGRALTFALQNLTDIPSSAAALVDNSFAGLGPTARRIVYGGLGLWFAYCVVVVCTPRGRRRVRDNSQRVPRPLWVLILTSPASLLGVLLTGARPELLFAMLPGAWVLAGLPTMPHRPGRAGSWVTAACASGLIAISIGWPGPFVDAPRRQPVRETVALLVHCAPNTPVRLLGPHGHGAAKLAAWYGPQPNIRGFSLHASQPLDRAIRDHRPTHLTLAPDASWFALRPDTAARRAWLDAPPGDHGRESVTSNGTLLFELTESSTTSRRPKIEASTDDVIAAENKIHVSFTVVDAPAGSRVALQLAAIAGTETADILGEAIADDTGRATFSLPLDDAIRGTAVGVRAIAVSSGRRVFVSHRLEMTIGM